MDYNKRMIKLCDQLLSDADSVSRHNWMYEDGVLLEALYRAGGLHEDARILPYLKGYVDTFVTEDGRLPCIENRPSSADCLNNGKVIMTVYETLGGERYEKVLRYLYDYIGRHPRLTGSRGFAHKVVYPDQMWLDGLYMMEPLYARLIRLFGPEKRYEDVGEQFALILKYAYDEEKQLFYHAYDHSRRMFWSDDVTGCSPCFWGRAMGWLSMAAVDCLDVLPDQRPERKILTDLLKKLAAGLARYQDGDGLWHQVVDQVGREGNYQEASCSCMFVYSLKKSVRKGYIDPVYEQAADKGMEGIFRRLVTEDEAGKLHIKNVCLVAGLGPEKKPWRNGTYEYYISEPVVEDDNKARGPLLLALGEYAAVRNR